MTDKEQQDQDFKWFLDNIESLFKQYGDKVAVVKNKIILSVHDTFSEALEDAKKTEKLGTFLVQRIYESKNKINPCFSGHNNAEAIYWLKK